MGVEKSKGWLAVKRKAAHVMMLTNRSNLHQIRSAEKLQNQSSSNQFVKSHYRYKKKSSLLPLLSLSVISIWLFEIPSESIQFPDRITEMENLPADVCRKIFCLFDHQSLASAQQVCRRWRDLGSDNTLWLHLFEERWGRDHAAFYAPNDSKLWKDVYQVQDRCDRVGLGLKIIREGRDYYLIHQGEIERHLGSRRPRKGAQSLLSDGSETGHSGEGGSLAGEYGLGILDRILFFIGDLESASVGAKRIREV